MKIPPAQREAVERMLGGLMLRAMEKADKFGNGQSRKAKRKRRYRAPRRPNPEQT